MPVGGRVGMRHSLGNLHTPRASHYSPRSDSSLSLGTSLCQTLMNSPLQTHQRQIHLDFHTSPYIPDVGSEFNANEFAQTLKKAHDNSVTTLAKCHHGMCYFPTKTGTQHPALNGRDMLGEQIEALHRAGIRAP